MEEKQVATVICKKKDTQSLSTKIECTSLTSEVDILKAAKAKLSPVATGYNLDGLYISKRETISELNNMGNLNTLIRKLDGTNSLSEADNLSRTIKNLLLEMNHSQAAKWDAAYDYHRESIRLGIRRLPQMPTITDFIEK